MAIFSRRDVQAALNSLSASLSKKQLETLVGRLNGNDPSDHLATEWEIVVLSAFQQVGRIEYEKEFGGERRPDLFFKMGESGNFEFTADVTTISDVNARDENAYDSFRDAIRRYLKKRGHTSTGLDIRVEHESVGKYGDQKVRLMLPKKGEMDQFVKNELGEFLTTIAKEPNKSTAFPYAKNGIHLNIRYNSNEKQFSGGGHISYTVPYSQKRNPLHNALKKKAEQLSKSKYAGLRGIIICDGDCDAINERNPVSGAHGCEQIVIPFLRNHESILFILVLRIEQTHGAFLSDRSLKVMAKLYWNPKREKAVFREIEIVIKRMLQWLPAVEATPSNAARWLASRNKNVGHPIGGISMQGNTIKISTRALTELLAGKIDQKQFLEEHNLKASAENPLAFPFFECQMQRGNMLKNTFIESGGSKDDDWIVLEYDGPDAAISRYHVPA